MNNADQGFTVNTPNGVSYFRLSSLKLQLKMEAKGLKSTGGAIRPRIAAEFGLKPRDSHEKYIQVIQAKMDEILKQQNTPQS